MTRNLLLVTRNLLLEVCQLGNEVTASQTTVTYLLSRTTQQLESVQAAVKLYKSLREGSRQPLMYSEAGASWTKIIEVKR